MRKGVSYRKIGCGYWHSFYFGYIEEKYVEILLRRRDGK